MASNRGCFDKLLDNYFNLLSVKVTPIASDRIMRYSVRMSPHRACSTEFMTNVAYAKHYVSIKIKVSKTDCR